MRPETKALMISLMGAFATDVEVQQALRDKRGVKLPIQAIRRFRREKKVQDAVMEARESNLGALQDLALADKRIRLQHLDALLEQHGSDPEILLRVLDAARKETMDGGTEGSRSLHLTQNNQVIHVELDDREAARILRDFGAVEVLETKKESE